MIFHTFTGKTLNFNGRDSYYFNIFGFFLSFPFSGMQHEASFTSNFARLLEAKAGQLPLKEMVKRVARASFNQHRLSSNLLDPK